MIVNELEEIKMKIIPYEKHYKNQVIALILYLQNFDNKVDLSLEEQPDMNDIETYYLKNGGGFWLAINEIDDVIGTLGLMKKEGHFGILKKFFVDPTYRGKEVGVSKELYDQLINHAKQNNIDCLVLDTPANCKRAHHFYIKKGFQKIKYTELPFDYDFPNRDSYFFLNSCF